MGGEDGGVPEELRRQVELQEQRLEQERNARLAAEIALSERTTRLEEMAQKVNYALFGLQGNNGLIGSLDKLATSLQSVNRRIDEKDEKDDHRWAAKEAADAERWSGFQWKLVAGFGAVIILLLTAFVAILTHT